MHKDNEHNDSEKFYNTYGKETSFEIFPREASYKAPESNEPVAKPSVSSSIKKYLALTVFIAIVGTIVLVGGIFMIAFLSIMLLGMLIRTIFFRSSGGSSGIYIIKK